MCAKEFNFSQAQRKILSIVQGDLPSGPCPFARVAEMAGTTEDEVLSLLQELKDAGAIRRFGATLRHQKAGYGFNAMVAWYVEEGQDISAIGKIMAARPEITHCYERRTCLDWPYSIYTMVHARSREECQGVVQELAQATGVDQFEMLFSKKELKKTSMRYF